MKRLFTILSAMLLFAATSCSDDDTPASDDLSGTVWSQTDGSRSDTFYFALDHKCTYEWQIGDFDPIVQKCRYSYRAPEVTIKTSGRETKGRIENDVLIIHYYDRDLALKRIR